MQMRQLVDTILARCQALKLQSPTTGLVDTAAVELMLLHVLQGLSDTYDFETLQVFGNPLFVTVPGERTYALPDDFQRFLLPKDAETDGLWLHDGYNANLLTYRSTDDFRRQWSVTNGPPMYFSLGAGPSVVLDPPPDTNTATSQVGYHGVGTYIRTVTPDLLDGAVPLLFPAALVEMTLAVLALDSGHAATPVLLVQGEQARTRLVNAHARLAQQFQSRFRRIHHYATI
jgi:hypothetical protein